MKVLVRALAAVTALVVGIAMPGVAIAHNAGHIFRPDGSCLELGSFKHAPLVGADRTRLDLVPQTPRDEFGVSFVGYWDTTPTYPGPCPAGSTMPSAKGISGSSPSSLAAAAKASTSVARSAAPAARASSSAEGGRDRRPAARVQSAFARGSARQRGDLQQAAKGSMLADSRSW